MFWSSITSNNRQKIDCAKPRAATREVSEAVCRSMDHHEPGNAEPQDKRASNKGRTQRARGIEAPMAPKSDHDIPLQVRSIPAGQATADLSNHCHLKQTAAGGAQQADHSKGLGEQEFGHSNLAANSPYAPTNGFNGRDCLYYPTYPVPSTAQNHRYVPKVTAEDPTNVGYSGVR